MMDKSELHNYISNVLSERIDRVIEHRLMEGLYQELEQRVIENLRKEFGPRFEKLEAVDNIIKNIEKLFRRIE